MNDCDLACRCREYLTLQKAARLLGFGDVDDERVTPATVDYGSLFYMSSWVVSAKARESIRIREEEWPEGTYILIKAKVTAGDQEMITEATYQAHLVSTGDGR